MLKFLYSKQLTMTRKSLMHNALGRNAAIAIISLGLSLGTASTTLAQSKPTLSVPEFKNESSWWWWRGGTSRELADALSNELSSTGKFTVVERQKLGQVLDEQELAEYGLVRPDTAAQKGQLTGAQYIVLGKVTAYEEDVSEESNGRRNRWNVFGIGIGGGKRQEQKKSYLAIDLRVVNSTTGEIAYSRTIEGRATSTSESNSNSYDFGIYSTSNDSSKSEKAPVGKALRAALAEATDYLSCAMVDQNGCLAEFDAKERKRRDSNKGVLDLD